MNKLAGFVLLPLSLAGCATGLPCGARAALGLEGFRRNGPPAPPRELPGAGGPGGAALHVGPAARERAVSAARSLVGSREIVLRGKRYPSDCTGLVLAVYGPLGLDLLDSAQAGDNGVTAIYRFAREHGRIYEGGWPLPGDLVFFRDTYDQNRDGRANDGLTHVGIVEGFAPDGTVTVIHRVRRGVVRYHMNLAHRELHLSPGSDRALNDYLRAPGGGRGPLLTGQLFAAYATVLPVK